jgi:acetyl-CoA carboxylase biotin carboxyl carrier protein
MVAGVPPLESRALGVPAAHGESGWMPATVAVMEGAAVSEVRAEMVANVLKVVVAEGDSVAAGDTVVILESMKMEIPVLVEQAGTVQQMAVAEGDVVQDGDLIAVVT